ncbi:MAG: hypothetical protein ACXVHQ_42270 [Solirubrobacteraceae bacterium]
MLIVVEVVGKPVEEHVRQDPQWGHLGHRLVFGDNLVLKEVDGKKPGNGLPGSEHDPPRAGTQSGFLTIVATDESDLFIPVPDGGVLYQHESTYRLNAVPGTPPPGLPEGQITTQGVFLYPTAGPKTLAITGGTGAYANARGQITEEEDKPHKLEIVL